MVDSSHLLPQALEKISSPEITARKTHSRNFNLTYIKHSFTSKHNMKQPYLFPLK